MQAILENDVERVKRLVASGESLFSRDQMDLAPLDYAAGAMPEIHGQLSGSVAIADLLLRQACDVNGTGKFGRTPLMYAVRGSNLDLIRLLIHHGADVDRISNDGHTALFCARLDKNEPVITLLQDVGAKSEGSGEGSPSTFKWIKWVSTDRRKYSQANRRRKHRPSTNGVIHSRCSGRVSFGPYLCWA